MGSIPITHPKIRSPLDGKRRSPLIPQVISSGSPHVTRQGGNPPVSFVRVVSSVNCRSGPNPVRVFALWSKFGLQSPEALFSRRIHPISKEFGFAAGIPYHQGVLSW
jgi:hypothetical protein